MQRINYTDEVINEQVLKTLSENRKMLFGNVNTGVTF